MKTALQLIQARTSTEDGAVIIDLRDRNVAGEYALSNGFNAIVERLAGAFKWSIQFDDEAGRTCWISVKPGLAQYSIDGNRKDVKIKAEDYVNFDLNRAYRNVESLLREVERLREQMLSRTSISAGRITFQRVPGMQQESSGPVLVFKANTSSFIEAVVKVYLNADNDMHGVRVAIGSGTTSDVRFSLDSSEIDYFNFTQSLSAAFAKRKHKIDAVMYVEDVPLQIKMDLGAWHRYAEIEHDQLSIISEIEKLLEKHGIELEVRNHAI
jgi:hypothetical protein